MGEEVGRLNASCVEDRVERPFLTFLVEDVKRLVNQLMTVRGQEKSLR